MLRRGAIAVLAALALLSVAVAVVRMGATTEAGRRLAVRLLDGMKLGPIGRLHLEGLQGDLLGDLRLRRLSIADAKGPWLDARDVALRWRPVELVGRRVHIVRLSVGDLVVSRRPELEKRPPSAPSKPPVGVRIDALMARVRTGRALTVAAGDFDLVGGLDLRRSGRIDAQVRALSRLHAGDHLYVDLRMTDRRRLSLRLDGVEAAGGAMAGGMGLPADQPLRLFADGRSDDDGGRIRVDARSGALRPLWADGAWTRAGGHVEAHALLAASRLTQPFVARIGPEADLKLDVRRAGALYATDAVVTGTQTQAHATGPVDFAKLSTPGLDLDVATRTLSAWFHPPAVGATRAHGVLTGSVSAFTIKAQAVGQGLEETGLKVARMAGPLEVSLAKGEWRIKADLKGEGGGGEGLLPMLLGPRPAARIDLSFLRDKRLLFRELHVTGSYARIDATGAQTLLGGLGFQGTFTAPSLAGMRPGAGGALQAGWKASAPRNSPTWSLAVDARGERFRTGIAELDRLLGPAPHLAATGVMDPAGLHIARADLTGAAAKASASGLMGADKRLGFDLSWSAQGPFAAGPVEIAGAMTGKGRIAGTIGEPEADLEAQLATLDLGRLVVRPAQLKLAFTRGMDAMTGRMAVSGPSNFGPAHVQAAFRMGANTLDLSEIDADAGGVQLGGAIALRDGAPSTADLTVVAGQGAFLGAGKVSGAVRIAGAPGAADAHATITLDGRGLALPGSTVTFDRLALNAQGPLARLPYRLTVAGQAGAPFSWTGDGVYARQGAVQRLTASGAGKVRGAAVSTVEPALLTLGPDGRGARLRLAVGGGRAAVDAAQTGALDGRRRTTLHAQLSKVSLEAAAQDFTGALDADLSLTGEGPQLSGRLDAALSGARARDAARDLALDGRVHAELGGDRLRLSADATNAQGLKAHTTLDLPVEAAADPFRIALVKTRPMTGGFDVDGELKPLWDLFGGGERTLAGRLTAQGVISGTLNDPKAVGRAQLAKGAFQDLSTGLALKQLEVSAELGRDAVHVSRFSGVDGHGGALSGDGSVALTRDGASTFELQLKRFQLIDNELGKATASGAVTVTRDAQGHARLAGKLLVDRADISAASQSAPGVVHMDVVEVNRPQGEGIDASASQAAAASRTATLVALDVGVTAPRGVFVRGRGLDAELSLNAHVGGTVAKPLLEGTARVVRGSYEFSGKRFDFDESSVVHLATSPEAIRLDLTAERDDPALDAKVRITGTAARPDIALTSVPVLPQDEILSRVLFGVSASQLSPFEAAQLASALAGLATGGGFDVLGNLRQFAGLDRLTLGGDAAGASISGGKYLTDNIYVELTGAGVQKGESQTQLLQTGRTGSSASVEWRVRRNLSLVGQVWTGGDSRLSVRFRKTYGASGR